MAGLGIQGYEIAVQPAQINSPRSESNPAANAAAADFDVAKRRHFPRNLGGLVCPDLLPRRRVKGKHVAVSIHDVHRAVVDDRRCLKFCQRIQDTRVEHPRYFEVVHVLGVDLVEVLETRVGAERHETTRREFMAGDVVQVIRRAMHGSESNMWCGA